MPAKASTFNSLETVLNDNLLSDGDALAGIAKPPRASAFNSIDTLMNAETIAGFVQKGPQGLLEAWFLITYRTKLLLWKYQTGFKKEASESMAPSWKFEIICSNICW